MRSAYFEVIPEDSNEENFTKSFQARVFGLFYERLLETWFTAQGYRNLGRPSAYDRKTGKWTRITYDFYVQVHKKGYIVEAKSYPAFSDGRWKILTAEILHGSWDVRAFDEFLRADFLSRWTFKVNSVEVTPAGKILVWWDFDKKELERIKGNHGIDSILSIRRTLDELRRTKNPEYINSIAYYRKTIDSLFETLQV